MVQVIWVVCLEGSKNSCSTVIDLKAEYKFTWIDRFGIGSGEFDIYFIMASKSLIK